MRKQLLNFLTLRNRKSGSNPALFVFIISMKMGIVPQSVEGVEKKVLFSLLATKSWHTEFPFVFFVIR